MVVAVPFRLQLQGRTTFGASRHSLPRGMPVRVFTEAGDLTFLLSSRVFAHAETAGLKWKRRRQHTYIYIYNYYFQIQLSLQAFILLFSHLSHLAC